MTKRKFLAMCRQHMQLHHNNPDHRYWTTAAKSFRKLMEASHEVGYDVAAPIWNMVVDEQGFDDATDWYWE